MSEAKSSREAILGRLRNASVSGPDLPDVPNYRIAGDPIENFRRNLKGYDGDIVEVPNRADALDTARKIAAEYARIFSAVPEVDGCGIPADAAEAQTVGAAVVEASIGVGETGSVWLTYDALRSPGAVLFSEHVIVLLDIKNIVDGMHTAYELLNQRGWDEICYGSWFTGPSATADIEAVRVVGAQGPRALTVVLYGSPE